MSRRGPPQKLDLEAAEALHSQGVNPIDIAKQLRCHHNTVRYHARRLGWVAPVLYKSDNSTPSEDALPELSDRVRVALGQQTEKLTLCAKRLSKPQNARALKLQADIHKVLAELAAKTFGWHQEQRQVPILNVAVLTAAHPSVVDAPNNPELAAKLAAQCGSRPSTAPIDVEASDALSS